MRICELKDCMNPAPRRKLCEHHYRRKLKYGSPYGVPSPKAPHPPEDRFFPRLSFGPLFQGTRCLEWTGDRWSTGYGRFSVNGKQVGVHRWLYERWVGPIPDGLVIDHLCRNIVCCNPEHLEPVTNAENVRRGVGPAAQNRLKTHCKYGHPFAGRNLGTDAFGRRICRACSVQRTLRSRARRAVSV